MRTKLVNTRVELQVQFGQAPQDERRFVLVDTCANSPVRRLDYSNVIPHRFGVVTVFLLVRDVFSGLFGGAVDGSGYADGSRPTCVWSSRISWSAGSGEARLTTG